MYLPVKLQNGEQVYVEVQAESIVAEVPIDRELGLVGAPMGAPKTATAIAEKHFGDAVRVAQGIAAEVTEGLVKKEDPSRRLSEVTLQLELGFSAGGHVFVAQGSANAALKLTLKWALQPPTKA